MLGAAAAGAAAAYDMLSRDDDGNGAHRHSSPKQRKRLRESGWDIVAMYRVAKLEKEPRKPKFQIWYTTRGTGNVLDCSIVECTFPRLVEQLGYLAHMHPHHIFWYEEVI